MWPARVVHWLRGRQQEASVAGLIAAVYALYLLTSEYQNLYYDAENYWQLGHRFYKEGRFSLLAYDDALRGYAYPLVNFACLGLRKAFDLRAVTVVKLLNAALAGTLFGVVGPRLWQVTAGQATLPSVGRRLLWAALGFVFWRDYFNFSLSDFPALLALGLALWQAQRRRASAAFLTGLALALALNVRPVYVAAAPAVLLLLLLGTPRRVWLARLALFTLGAALILAPQWLINRRQFGANTPLVLSQSRFTHTNNLYLQLEWGLLYQKYESSVGRELPTGQMLFLNPGGAALLRAEGITNFHSLQEYIQVVAHHPVPVIAVYAKHLFNGLNITHPSPYLHRWAPSLARNWLNYTLCFGAVLVALGWQRPKWRQVVVLAGLLLPCLAVLPMCMEARFLLPLHLLLLAIVAFGRWPAWPMKNARRQAAVGVAYGLFLAACFTLSARSTRTVEPRFRAFLLVGPPQEAIR